MIPQLSLVAFGLASLASALSISPRDGVTRCGAPDPSVQQIEEAKALSILEVNMASTASLKAETIVVDTYFHIVASSESEAGGYLSVSSNISTS